MARRQPTLNKLVCDAIPKGAKILVAVSGGKDSVALLHTLLSLMGVRKVMLEVAHVDHGLREDSARDGEFVAQLATSNGLPFHLSTLTPPSPAVNLESWGRRARYSFFEKIISERGLDWVVTAHTANDVAETLLMRLFANKGVGNILPRDERRRVLRPILRATRAQIDEYASSANLTWREDSTNKETVFTRNRVRHEVLPVIAGTFGESIIRTLSERGMSLSEDELYLSHLALVAIEPLLPFTFDSPQWLRSASEVFSTLSNPLQWRGAELLLLPAVGYPIGPRRGALVAEAIILGKGRIDLGGNLQVTATSHGVMLSKEGTDGAVRRVVSEDFDPFDPG